MIGGLKCGQAFFCSRCAVFNDRWGCVKLLMAVLSAGPVMVATAQDATGRGDGVPTCNSLSSASRTRAACGEEEQTVLRVERELTILKEAVELESRQCATIITVEYFQRDTIARVHGEIGNETCASSNGHYEIEARVKHESGETETLVFTESWQRDDDQTIEFTADYPIGDNVELTRLRSRGLHCTCSDPIEE